MKLRIICMFAVLSAIAPPFYAQDKQERAQWTLEDCINYALEKNIQLQQDKISLQESEIDIKDARASLFPTLSFSTGHNVVNRPYQEQSATVSGTEIISSDSRTTYNGSYSLNAAWTLWNGGKRLNTLKQQKTNKAIAQLSVSETENTLQEQIAQLFIQILYADESISINKGTLEVSEATYKRGEELFKEGSISKADLAQLEAQVSNDKYQVVSAESSLRDYKLQLKQLLELDGTEEMDLVLPQLEYEDIMRLLPNQTDIYQTALSIRPEIQSGKLSIENAKLGISAAKAGYYPTISLSASSSSMTNNASTNNWAQQMKYGWNNMISINLSIPIFDNRQNKSNVQKARLQYNTSQLDLINKQKELYSTIEGLWLDALNAQQQYAAAETKVKSSQTSFDMVNEQFNLGMKNTVELLTEKNNLLSAKQELVQAKYMAILSRTLLNFYAGNNIEL
ncbi:TolC family protein [Phocaeicola salanitronis]|uniref:TolC family protein n=1 Tax=Phocaeicola salanitronis TaxID=376805 RepID=UPI0023F7A7BB|nr:TolC family protein [Phocaeicola salanitronis]